MKPLSFNDVLKILSCYWYLAWNLAKCANITSTPVFNWKLFHRARKEEGEVDFGGGFTSVSEDGENAAKNSVRCASNSAIWLNSILYV